MLVGIWLDQPEEEYFDRIVVGIDHLLPWSKQSGLEQEFSQANERWKSFTNRWKPTDALEARVGDATVALRLGCSVSERSHADRTAASLIERADLAITVAEPRSAESLISQWTAALQDLVTFAMDTRCGLHEITLVRTNPPVPAELATPSPEAIKVEVYLAPLYRAKPDAKAVLQMTDSGTSCRNARQS